MTDRQIIDIQENTDGLMVSTEDEKARERSRDCVSMERWSDDIYNGMTEKSSLKHPIDTFLYPATVE